MMHDVFFRKAELTDQADIAHIFAHAYRHEFLALTKNMDKIVAVFKEGINTDTFFVAQRGGKLVAIASVSTHLTRAACIDKAQCKKVLGFLKGSIFGNIATKLFNTPVATDHTTGYIEFVAVDALARGQGLSGKLMQHIIQNTAHTRYILDVRSDNTPAVKTYQKLGFTEFKKEKLKKNVDKIFMEWVRG